MEGCWNTFLVKMEKSSLQLDKFVQFLRDLNDEVSSSCCILTLCHYGFNWFNFMDNGYVEGLGSFTPLKFPPPLWCFALMLGRILYLPNALHCKLFSLCKYHCVFRCYGLNDNGKYAWHTCKHFFCAKLESSNEVLICTIYLY
jgi:hypothetical protein